VSELIEAARNGGFFLCCIRFLFRTALSAPARDFVERATGQAATVTV